MKLPRIFYNILFLPLFAFGSLETDVEQIKSYTFSIYNKQTSIDSGVRNIMNDVEAIADRFVQETTARTSFRSDALSSLASIDSKLTNLASPNDYSSQLNKILSIMGSSAYSSSQDLNLFKFLFGSQYYIPSNNSLYRGGVYGMISDILQELKSKNFSPTITITNNVNPTFSITNNVNPSFFITNIVNSALSITNDIHNSIFVTNQMPTIVVSNFVNAVATNQIAGSVNLVDLLSTFGLYQSNDILNQSINTITNLVSSHGGLGLLELSPYYYATMGYLIPWQKRGNGLTWFNDIQRKSDVDVSVMNSLYNESIAVLGTPSNDSNDAPLTQYLKDSSMVYEGLFGTADIEDMFEDSTNHIAEISKIGPRIDNLEVVISNGFETVVMTLYQFTNLMQNVSVSSLVNSNQFAGALQDSVETMPASFTDTSILSISNATIYATEDNGYSTLLTQNAISENSFDYSRFETSVRSFVQVWENGVNVGSPTLNIHFMGVDTGQGNPTLEQTIDFDFELPQTAKDKIGAFWSAIFALIKGSIIVWGFFRLFNAVLNANRKESSGHTDFTNVDVD